jgi:hypothetical protein
MKLSDFTRGFALKLVLDKLADRPPARAKGAKQRRRARNPSLSVAQPRPAPRGPMFAVMLASAAVAVPLMIIFDSPITRIVGVLGLFAFIVSGVFVIADPAFLEQEESP